MKKTVVIALCVCLILSLSACVRNSGQPAIGGDPATWGPAEDGAPKVPGEDSNVQIPNPFTEYDTLEDAAGAVGFGISVPDSIDGYSERYIRTLITEESKLMEVIYGTAEDGQVRIRKSPGSEDISGDYTVYDRTETAQVGELTVTMKGNGDTVNLVIWTNDGYAYSIYCSEGMAVDGVSQLIAAVA